MIQGHANYTDALSQRDLDAHVAGDSEPHWLRVPPPISPPSQQIHVPSSIYDPAFATSDFNHLGVEDRLHRNIDHRTVNQNTENQPGALCAPSEAAHHIRRNQLSWYVWLIKTTVSSF